MQVVQSYVRLHYIQIWILKLPFVYLWEFAIACIVLKAIENFCHSESKGFGITKKIIHKV